MNEDVMLFVNDDFNLKLVNSKDMTQQNRIKFSKEDIEMLMDPGQEEVSIKV